MSKEGTQTTGTTIYQSGLPKEPAITHITTGTTYNIPMKKDKQPVKQPENIYITETNINYKINERELLKISNATDQSFLTFFIERITI